MNATIVLSLIDSRLAAVRRHAGIVCRSTLSNDCLVMAPELWALARSACEPWARSFEMRAEEAYGLAGELLKTWREEGCAASCGCDCAAILANAAAPCSVGERGVW